jgi:catechol 2,3-dioxygenase-like lactoylglutathione lyase family enzyme
MDNTLLRCTFIVVDIEAAIRFYRDAMGWTLVYDNVLAVDRRFPPAAPDGAPCRLVVFQCDHPDVGGIGFMKYLQHPIASGPDKKRGKLAEGEATLVVKSRDPDDVYRRACGAGAEIVSPPANWTVPGYEPGTRVTLRSTSFFDPNGIYLEANLMVQDGGSPQ